MKSYLIRQKSSLMGMGYNRFVNQSLSAKDSVGFMAKTTL